MIRKKCVLCSGEIEKISTIPEMPIFMGVVDSNEDILREDLTIGECQTCGLLQNINLVDERLVYMNNHNIDVVGEIWNKHFETFSEFVLEKAYNGNILEIGDPNMKIANRISKNFGNWIIIEPNSNSQNIDNIQVINQFFDGKNPTKYNFSTIVHSHVLEHIYNPVSFLKDCFNILDESGKLIFSIPNIKWLMKNNSMPTNILHFEHTYYINIDNIEYFLRKSGFEIEDIFLFRNHSIFVSATKKSFNDEIQITKSEDRKTFLELLDYYKNKIFDINKKLNGEEYFLYSAHINSQYLLSNGISKNIKGLLDNAKSKIGKKLYGYEFEIFSPEILREEENPIVVASNMGVYFEEIKSNLLSINKNCIIL